MPADPFSCAAAMSGLLCRGLLCRCGNSGLGAASRAAVSCGSAVCGVWRGRRGGLPAGGCPVAWGRLRGAHRPVMGAGFPKVGRTGGECGSCGCICPGRPQGAAPGPCGPQFCSVRASAFGADVRRSLLCPAAAAPKRSAPETVHKGLRGAEREARSVIFPPASGSGRASRRIRGSTPASSAA